MFARSTVKAFSPMGDAQPRENKEENVLNATFTQIHKKNKKFYD